MKNIIFRWYADEQIVTGRLIYRESEYTLDFIDYLREQMTLDIGTKGCTSFTIGTVQVEASVETGKLLYPWGLCPMTRCESRVMSIKPMRPGMIFVDIQKTELVAGVALDLLGENSWGIFKDESTGWVCIGNDSMDETIDLVQFSSDAAISLKGETAIALWIRPYVD